MEEKGIGRITEHFGKVCDPRIGNATRHKLIDIIVIAICAVICGANSWVEVELFGKSKRSWFKTFLELPHGIPSHDTFGRVFALIDPETFRNSFLEWVQTIQRLTTCETIAIDGKQLRGSKDTGNEKTAIDMVSAWATASKLVLGQMKVDDKSNEIAAIPKLLQLLDIEGCVVTIDAIGTQTEIAASIVERGGDYVLSVKENQPQLYEDLERVFSVDEAGGFADPAYSYVRKVDNSHGRLEIRQCWAISSRDYVEYLRGQDKWKGLQTLAMIRSERRLGEKTEIKTRYFISSLALSTSTAYA
jgi:predicted transposase YbfD/YdcC